ncbi:MAG: HAD family hydrolase [Candidatus Heimdallarchaeota archaeon]
MTKLETLIENWKTKCIIFDLDGTLVDTLDKHIEAFKILFKELKINIEEARIAENMGRTPKDTLLTLLPELKDDNERLIEYAEKKEEILTTLLDDTECFIGARDLLAKVQELELTIALASSTPKYNVEKMLRSAGISEFFNVIITGEDITIGKPNPEVFLKAAKKAKCSIEHCFVIGDSPHDIEAAKNAQMKIVIVKTGKHTEDQLKAKKPEIIINLLEELLK